MPKLELPGVGPGAQGDDDRGDVGMACLDGRPRAVESWVASSGCGPGRTGAATCRTSKFMCAFDEVFAGNGMRIIKTPIRSPRANSFAERYVGTLRRECLDHLLIHDEQHLRHILAEYAQHYNDHRPRQSREQRPALHEPGQAIDVTARIKRRQTVQGLISEYRRAA